MDGTSTPSPAQRQGEAASSLSLGVCAATPDQHIVSYAFVSFVITQLLTCSPEPTVDA